MRNRTEGWRRKRTAAKIYILYVHAVSENRVNAYSLVGGDGDFPQICCTPTRQMFSRSFRRRSLYFNFWDEHSPLYSLLPDTNILYAENATHPNSVPELFHPVERLIPSPYRRTIDKNIYNRISLSTAVVFSRPELFVGIVRQIEIMLKNVGNRLFAVVLRSRRVSSTKQAAYIHADRFVTKSPSKSERPPPPTVRS